jgi:hypothetical protein
MVQKLVRIVKITTVIEQTFRGKEIEILMKAIVKSNPSLASCKLEIFYVVELHTLRRLKIKLKSVMGIYSIMDGLSEKNFGKLNVLG